MIEFAGVCQLERRFEGLESLENAANYVALCDSAGEALVNGSAEGGGSLRFGIGGTFDDSGCKRNRNIDCQRQSRRTG